MSNYKVNPDGSIEQLIDPSVNKPVKKTRTKKTPEEIAAIKECRDRVSLFGNKYPRSNPADWRFMADAGWIFFPEECANFNEHYFCCYITDKYFKKEDGVGSEHGFISKTLITDDWALDPISELYFKKCEGRQVNINKKKVLISDSTFRARFRKCDYDGQYYSKGDMISMTGNHEYKYVYSVNAEQHFSQCQSCGGYHIKALVKIWPEFGSARMCVRCGEKKQYEGVILSHDNKEYPKSIGKKVTRMGAIQKDGLWCATNKPVEVPVVRYFGAEVETEFSMSMAKKANATRGKVAYNVREALGKDFAMIKEDGTLTMNGKYSDTGDGCLYAGFEVVTAPADLATHRERWHKLEQSDFYSMLRAWDTETCGFHCHVSRAALSDLQIGRMLFFVNHKKNKNFIQLVAGRSEKKFTRYVPKNVSDVLHPERVVNPDEEKSRDRARRVALNVSNRATVEFRIFRGTINPKHILRNIEFCDAVCDFCLPCSRSMAELADPKHFWLFVGYNRKKWPLLAEWMVLHELIKLRPISDKANKDRLTLNPTLVEEGEDKTDEGLLKLQATKKIPAADKAAVTLNAPQPFVYDALDYISPFSSSHATYKTIKSSKANLNQE